MTERNDAASAIAAIQAPILLAAKECFSRNEIESLRCLIRLSVEFEFYARAESKRMGSTQLDYLSGSVFAGMECFTGVAQAYRTLRESVQSRITWSLLMELKSPSALIDYYRELYGELLRETQFDGQCRIMLDLFKLQLVFVSMLYGS